MTDDSYFTVGARQDRAADRQIQERQAKALEKIAEILDEMAQPNRRKERELADRDEETAKHARMWGQG